MYLNRVAVTENGNGVSVTRFSSNDMTRYGHQDEDQFISWYMNRIKPGISYEVISEDDIPKDQNGKWDKSKRDSWSLTNGKIESDSSKEKMVKEKSFNIDLMTKRMGMVFTGISGINLAPYLEAFRSFGRARNFAGMKSFRDGLVALGKASQQDADNITSIVSEQGIDLSSY